MSEFIHIAERDGNGRDVFYLSVPDFASIPAKFSVPTERFVLLLACDSDELGSEEIAEWAQKILNDGAVYVCAWGKDCERVHDIIDEVYVEREIATAGELPFVMTTWHDKDSLDDALWYALNCTDPAEDSADTDVSTLILNVKNSERDIQIRSALGDIKKFTANAVQGSKSFETLFGE